MQKKRDKYPIKNISHKSEFYASSLNINPSSTIKMLKSLFTFHGGCACGRPKPKDVYEPKPKAGAAESFDHDPKPSLCHSSSSYWERGVRNSIDDDLTSSTYSFNNNDDTSTNCSEHGQHNPCCSKMVTPFPRLGDSVAVIKDSEDPYQDFRQSMLQMILEKEIFSKDDLQELLNCFLQLNSSSHHRTIVQAFMDIWNGVLSKKPEDQHHDQIAA